jgi:hypothetical protein
MGMGTVPMEELLTDLVAENWVRHHPGILSADKEESIREKLRNDFFPEKDDVWLECAWMRLRNVLEAAVRWQS